MTSGDSQGVRLRLEQVMAQWRQWHCEPPLPGAPHLLGPLQGGLSNNNFLVRAATMNFVVRIDGINPARHGLNRQVEWLAMRTASNAGLAPTPRYFNPDLGALVVDFQETEPGRKATACDLAKLIRSIHALPRRHHRVDLSERVRRYRHWLQREGKTAEPAAYSKRIDSILAHVQEHGDRQLVLTHNDLTPANLLYSKDRLLALDWEYCGMGSPWFDLAVASLGQEPDRDGENTLLEHYLGERPSATQTSQLRRYRAIGRYLELLWHLAQSPLEDAPALLERGIPLLESELP